MSMTHPFGQLTTYTIAEKLASIDRELRKRRRVYPREIAAGRMSREEARREVEIMEAIRADYALEAAKNPREAGLLL
jgi:hypothetical protein